MKRISLIASALLLGLGSAAHAATFTFFDNSAAYFAATGTATVSEGFNGTAQQDFGPGTTNAAIGSGLTLSVVNDPGEFGASDHQITGTGFLEIEVDNGAAVPGSQIDFGGAYTALALEIQNDNISNATGLHLSEVGLLLDGMSLMVSDLLGLTNSATATNQIGNFDSTGPVFLGFVFQNAVSSVGFLHGDDVGQVGVLGSSEDFYIDNLYLGSGTYTNGGPVAPVPLPAGLPLLLAGLGGLAMVRRRG